ncbi:hypothetical protein Z043_115182 [Scleropages formosus]|uniref:Ig-like domain-containing protein n=1 Tax=Scleropages formosus TaxID=113540 RepID=A0A0P7YH33_SCLFO|nr:hypothetical protein Z043_115182 [Scleropages formosus]
MSMSLARSTCPKSCSCPSPREVHCTFRHLKSAPSSLPDDTERVNLGYNSIQQLGTSDFARLQRLEMLMLHGNDITTISPGAFYNLRSLQILKLSYNKLKRLDPSMFQGLQGLVRLYLDHNAISFIEPFTFSGLMSLRLLQMEGNQLRELHPHTFITISVSGCFWGSSLRHLHLADNRLEHLRPGTLQHLDRLEVLSLHGNLWACDCHLHWLQDWNKKKEGVIKCKKERNSGPAESCAACATPQHLYGSQIFHMSPEQLLCERPMLSSPLKLRDSTIWEDSEPDLPYTKDLEPPLGHLTFMLSDSHGNQAHVSCVVSRPSDGSSVTWENLKTPGQVVVNVTLVSHLECEIDRDELQKLWRLVAYYYESPAILERGPRQNNTTFQYSQTANEESPYFTELKGQLMAEPEWLLQPRVTLQLNRRRTTTKKLVLNFSAFISKQIDSWEEKEASRYSWAMIQRAGPGRIQAVLEGSDARLECKVIGSGGEKIEWMLPDLSLLNNSHPRLMSYESGILVINKVTLSDSGLYHCLLRTDNDIDVVSFRLTVRELLLSPESLNGQVMSVESGKPLLLPCSVSSVQPMEIIWYLPRNQILKPLPPNGRTYVLSNGTLVISKASHEDAGEYSCLASNLYGVDMLSHLVVITGDKDSEPLNGSGVVAEELPGGTPMKVVKPSMEDPENEGSGFQELKRSVPTKTPHTTSGRLHSSNRNLSQGNKGTKVKEAKRKLNKSVKELDPHRWAQILAKAHSKGQKVYPTTSIAFGKITPANRPTPVLATPTPTPTTTSTTPPHTDSVTITTFDYNEPKGLSTSSPIYHDSNVSNYPKPQLNVTSFIVSDTGRNQVSTPSLQLHTQTEQSLNKRLMKDRVKSNNNALEGHRRRPPFRRRRPPHRRIQLINSTQNPSILSVSNSEATTNHPWLRTKHTHKHVQIPNTQPPSTATFSWGHANRFPIRPSIHSSRHHPSSPYRPWHSQSAAVTNRPEITALTVKATALPFASPPALIPQPPLNNSVSRTRDHLLLTRLRNRYRQSQLDAYRLSQLGKTIMLKPRTNSPTPKPHEAPKTQKSFAPVTPTPFPWEGYGQHSTASILYGSRWHYSHWGPRRLSTALPFPHLMGSGTKPRIISTSTVSVSTLAEADVILPCKSLGQPEPVLSWTKVSTGATIQANTKHGQRFEVLSNGTFVIRNVQLQDRGQYLCTAQNKFGTDRMVVTLAVLTQTPKIMHPNFKDFSVYLGRPITLDCVAVGKPQAQVSWILPDRTFLRDVWHQNTGLPGLGPPGSAAVQLLSNGTLRIQAANFSSKGNYKCIASNAAGADTLTYNINVAALPPAIEEEASESTVLQTGGNIYLHCTAKGEPPPTLKWSLPKGIQIKPSQVLGGRLFVFPNGTLYMTSTTSSDSGRYECSAVNAVGMAKRVVQLDIVQGAFSPRQHQVKAMYGSTVYLHCPESMKSPRGALWTLPSKILLDSRYSPERPVTVFPNGTLRIHQLTAKDGGSYRCMFQRANGEDMELFQVEVLMKPPKIENLETASKKVVYGANFQVDCVASGLPDPEVSWSLPDGTTIGNALQSDDSGVRSRRYVIFGNGTLLLRQMEKADEGNYTCYAKNELGEDEMRVNVRVVQDSLRILSKNQVSVKGRLGEPAYMKCDTSGDLPPTIIWLSPNNNVIASSSNRYQILEDGTLVIRKVGVDDQGKYACVSRNSAGDEIKNVKLEVEAQEPQIGGKGGKTSMKVLAVSYQTKLLHCKAEGMPNPRITWTTPQGISMLAPYHGGRFQVHQNGSLELRGLRKTDEGRFVCQAKNDLGEASLEMELEVASLAEKPSFAMPNIEVLPLKVDAHEITLECLARGKPMPEFVWLLPNGTVLNPGDRLERFLHHPSNGTLRILRPVMGDKGAYRCLAKNVAGQGEKRYSLEPGKKPQIRGAPGPMKISFGQNLHLPCLVDAWPQATITWTLPSGLTLNKPQVIGKVTYLSNGTLQVKDTTMFDRGTYSCKVTNTFGSSVLSYPVAVMVYPPRITSAPPSITRVARGSPVTLTCTAAGTPKPEISWTLPGRTTLVPSNRFATQGSIHMTMEGNLVIQNPVLMNSGIYKCNAKNALGTDFKATYLQVI